MLNETRNENRGIWHRKLRTAILIFALSAGFALLALRGGYLQLPVRLVFPLVVLLAASPTVFWWSWADEWMLRSWTADRTNGRSSNGRWVRTVRVVLAAYTGAMLLPILMILARLRLYDALPTPAIMWLMIWHLSMLTAGLIGLVIWIIVSGALSVRRLPLRLVAGRPSNLPASHSHQPAQTDQLNPPNDRPDASDVPMTRRALLAGALAGAPLMLTGSAVLGGIRQEGRFRVRRLNMHLPRLPDRLRGLTVTHVSDLHVGRLFRPEHLGPVVDAVNELDSDIIAITGDVVDHSVDFLPAACDAFEQMPSRFGRFVVIGNHDLIDAPRQAVDYLVRRERNFLSDQSALLDIGGERMRIAGLFWSRRERGHLGAPGHYERVAKIMSNAEPGVFTLGLAHHPHAFEALADAGVDLTLAGHTHGGQLMLTPPGADRPVGGGNLLFRYIWGEYRRGPSALHVSSGVGNWFPLRINAPAEIVQIRLV